MKVSIVLNGNSEIIKLDKTDYIIAVDGGANILFKNHILPNSIIGDLDSVEKNTLEYFRKNGVEILKFPSEKDETDCELAIRYAISKNASEIEILNFFGERLDMILALFGLMKKYKMKIVAKSEKVEIGIIRNTLEMETNVNELWSFIALCDAKISLHGFKYKFNGNMEFSNPIGVSNITISSKIKIEVIEGEVIYFRWKKNPL
ncbi:MAG: thiamine pyrophosphokinae [Thermosipho sp. (in: thermotogales)]|nr:thiamine pyrophosphokinae [Thermosipho sp. (in: thermotogales)]MDN5325027.1 thiamine pyrophosphokinae [Thermosipho sp. (in: thermotogales)]